MGEGTARAHFNNSAPLGPPPWTPHPEKIGPNLLPGFRLTLLRFWRLLDQKFSSASLAPPKNQHNQKRGGRGAGPPPPKRSPGVVFGAQMWSLGNPPEGGGGGGAGCTQPPPPPGPPPFKRSPARWAAVLYTERRGIVVGPSPSRSPIRLDQKFSSAPLKPQHHRRRGLDPPPPPGPTPPPPPKRSPGHCACPAVRSATATPSPPAAP